MKRAAVYIILVFLVFPVTAQEETVKKDALELYRQGEYRESVEVCKKELEIYTDDQISKKMDSYTVLCWSLLALKDYDGVIEYGKEGLTYYRYDNRIIFSIAQAYYFQGKMRSALDYFQQYTLLNPTGRDIKTAYYYMGEVYLRLGKYSHADIAFSTALYHSPQVAEWWTRLGYARELADDDDNAVEAYKKALELKPGLADASAGLERLEGIR